MRRPQPTDKERRQAAQALARREPKQPYAAELDDRETEQAQKQQVEKPKPRASKT